MITMRLVYSALICCVALSCPTLSPAADSDALGKARSAISKGQYSEARALIAPLAENGNAEAQLHLGLMLYHGQGGPENEKRAVELLSSSAGNGNVDAMYHLGNAYAFGNTTQGLVADADAEAAKWYFKAASAGNVEAQYALGLLFVVGKGVAKNMQEANQWMSRAAKSGHVDAQKYIGSSGR